MQRKSAELARVVFGYFPQSWTTRTWQAHVPAPCLDESIFLPSGDCFEVLSHTPGADDTSIDRSILIKKNSASVDEWVSSQDVVFRSFPVILVNHTLKVQVTAFIGEISRHVKDVLENFRLADLKGVRSLYEAF